MSSPWNLTHFQLGDRVVTLLYRGDQVYEPHYETWIVTLITYRIDTPPRTPRTVYVHLRKLLANGEPTGTGWSISTQPESNVIEEVYRNGKKYTKETAPLLRALP